MPAAVNKSSPMKVGRGRKRHPLGNILKVLIMDKVKAGTTLHVWNRLLLIFVVLDAPSSSAGAMQRSHFAMVEITCLQRLTRVHQ